MKNTRKNELADEYELQVKKGNEWVTVKTYKTFNAVMKAKDKLQAKGKEVMISFDMKL